MADPSCSGPRRVAFLKRRDAAPLRVRRPRVVSRRGSASEIGEMKGYVNIVVP